MGHVFDFHDATAYEESMQQPENRLAFEMEIQLLRELLQPRPGESVLDIGCGTGACLNAFVEMGLRVTGIDPSTTMLDLALHRVGNRVDLYRGVAEDLPFEDNSFNHACLFTSLEFVEDPKKALAEACRVARDRLFIGVLNRYAIKGLERWVKGMFTHSIYNHARFFSVWELKHMIYDLVGHVPISWRSVCQLPLPSGKFAASLEQTLLQRCPFGAFVGMVVVLVPRFRTRPLTVRYQASGAPGTVPG
ncbi:MAG: methyltransferase domain-containing protein [Desulfobacterales bacterium]|jgi:SAM-dependent methyltransferase|nr:methyltransferase domain-containing protein [Desulfobacterales bacterium]